MIQGGRFVEQSRALYLRLGGLGFKTQGNKLIWTIEENETIMSEELSTGFRKRTAASAIFSGMVVMYSAD